MAPKIIPNKIPQSDYDIGCRILHECLQRFFAQPGVQEDYEKWLVAYKKQQVKKEEKSA